MARKRKGIVVKGGPIGSAKTAERIQKRGYKSPRKRGKK